MKKKNTRFPGRPHYTGPTKGYFMLLHHEEILEWSDNVKERLIYIKDYKNPNEIKTRLRSIVYVPPKDLPPVIAKKLAKLEALEIAMKKAVQESDRLDKALDRVVRLKDRLEDQIIDIKDEEISLRPIDIEAMENLLDRVFPRNTWNKEYKILVFP